eukprot:COSAG02_NODE_10093_length_2025_cov_2.793354_2_plen_209_part_00
MPVNWLACLQKLPRRCARARQDYEKLPKLTMGALPASCTIRDKRDATPLPRAWLLLVLSAAGAGAGAASDTPPAAAFPASRLITPAQGELLNTWAKQTAGQQWELCYTSFTMSKDSPAEFHRRCDQYKPTVAVARNSGGRGICNKCARDCDPKPCNPCRGGGECSISGADCFPVGSPCGATNKGNFTFGGFVRPCLTLASNAMLCWLV